MSDAAPAFRCTLDVTAPSEEVATEWAVAHLKARGYVFAETLGNRETIGAFIQRIGISYDTLYRRLSDPTCPKVEILQARPPGKRMAAIRSNEAFEAFCREGKR